MRRFLIRNTAGVQVGEGVEWSSGGVAAMVSSLLTFSQTANAVASFEALGLSIDWIDPEPTDRSRDGDGGVIGFARVSYSEEIRPKMGRRAVERVPGIIRLDGPAPDPHAFQIRDGDPMILEGVEGHVKLTEIGLSFVPKAAEPDWRSFRSGPYTARFHASGGVFVYEVILEERPLFRDVAALRGLKPFTPSDFRVIPEHVKAFGEAWGWLMDSFRLLAEEATRGG